MSSGNSVSLPSWHQKKLGDMGCQIVDCDMTQNFVGFRNIVCRAMDNAAFRGEYSVSITNGYKIDSLTGPAIKNCSKIKMTKGMGIGGRVGPLRDTDSFRFQISPDEGGLRDYGLPTILQASLAYVDPWGRKVTAVSSLQVDRSHTPNSSPIEIFSSTENSTKKWWHNTYTRLSGLLL